MDLLGKEEDVSDPHPSQQLREKLQMGVRH